MYLNLTHCVPGTDPDLQHNVC